MGRASEEQKEEMGGEDYDEFICPECKKFVSDSESAYTTDGQQSEWIAGFRLCPECGWYGQPEEIPDLIVDSTEEELAKARCTNCGKKSLAFKNEISNQVYCKSCLHGGMFYTPGRLKIYLAGKVNGTKEDVVRDIGDVDFLSSDGNCHSQHLWGGGMYSLDGEYSAQETIKERFINVIKNCDFLIAWIDTADSYGSIAEIAYASAIGKKCFVFYDKDKHIKEKGEYVSSFEDTYWFVSNFPNVECLEISMVEAKELIKIICERNKSSFKKQFVNGFSSKIVYNELRTKEKEEFTKALSELKDLEKEDYEDLIKKEPMSKVIRYFKRDQTIVKELKELYKGKCQVKDCGYTFKKKDGENYCETHHINPLNKNGEDDVKNMVCLCPNHHKVLHFGTEEEKSRIEFEYKEEHYKLLQNGN